MTSQSTRSTSRQQQTRQASQAKATPQCERSKRPPGKGMQPRPMVAGNLGSDPEIRFTPSGKAVVTLSVATNPRRYDKDTGQWETLDTVWVRVIVWEDMAENVAECLRKGDRVLAFGRWQTREFEDREGEQRSITELIAEEIGPSLRWSVFPPDGDSGEEAYNGADEAEDEPPF